MNSNFMYKNKKTQKYTEKHLEKILHWIPTYKKKNKKQKTWGPLVKAFKGGLEILIGQFLKHFQASHCCRQQTQF